MEWTQLRSVAAKLQHGHFDELTADDGRLAGSLLACMARDHDSRERFFETISGVRPDPDHWDIAMHCALLLGGGVKLSKTVKGIVADRWGCRDSSIPGMIKVHRVACAEIVNQAKADVRARMLSEIEERAKKAKTR